LINKLQIKHNINHEVHGAYREQVAKLKVVTNFNGQP